MKINIGIDEEQRKAIAHGLSVLLADTYTLYLKTHNYHWNVTGPMFQTLHTLFETQYTELALAVDEIAERMAISTTTVAFHLRNLFSKTGVHREAALVALILSLPALRRGARPGPVQSDGDAPLSGA